MKAPPEEATGSEVRTRILRETLRLVGREGLESLSNRRVARAAEVSLGSLTYHFATQEDLLRDSLLLHVSEEVERIGAIADGLRARQPHPRPAEILATVQEAIGEGLERSEPLADMELHLKAARSPELRDASRRCFAAFEELAATALEALSIPEPERHATAVVALMYGMGLRQLGSGDHDGGVATAGLLTLVRGAVAEAQHAGTTGGS